jgi:hypothetical protein
MPEYDPGHSKGAGAQQNMGWLRELMLSANPPYKSYGQLARAALAHSDWPEHTRTQARSLASVLSKLDRQVDVQWLADRESVQRILAELLSCSFADVRSAVERQLSGPSTTPRRLRLEDLRYARTLDLTDEPLCPGLPSLVLCPAMWGACWWHAPSGSGRSLTANWLAARGLTATVCARNWTEAQNRTPVHGAVFIELHGPDDTPVHLPPGLGPVCVAAPFAPTGSTSSWRIIQSPPVECYLDELVDWVDAQLGASSRFDASFAKRWLRDGPAAQRGLVDRLGAVLGLCGLIDELGPRQLRGRSLHELSRRFFELRMAEAVEPTDAAWFKGTGYPVLLGMFKRLLTDGNAPWHEARTFDEWLHMVPLEHRQGADLDWMRLALLDGTTPVRAADIERAARRMPPGAYRVVRALRQARLLVPDHGGDRLLVRPHWFGHVMAAEAERLLVEGSAFEWGEALLRPHSAAAIATAIQARIGQGDAGPIEQVLEFEPDDSPAQVAALETAFRSVGLMLLAGAEVPIDQLETLWNEQIRLLVQLPGEPPRPRIAAPDSSARAYEHGAWLLAALAISEQLPAGLGVRHAVLRPWRAPSPPPGLEVVLDRVYDAAVGADAPWVQGAFLLADRLRSAIGSAGGSTVHPLERPGAVLEEIVHGVLSWNRVSPLGRYPAEVSALERLAANRGVPWPEVAEAIWHAWLQAGAADDVALLSPAGRYSARFWPHVPTPVLRHLLERGAGQSCPAIAFDCLSSTGWQTVSEALPTLASTVHDSLALWEAIPQAELRSALQGARITDPRVLRWLWERSPEALPGALDAWLDAGRTAQAVALLHAAPDRHTPAILSRIEPRLSQAPAELVDLVRAWLHERVARRGENWLAAYALLAAIERELARTGAPR